MRALAGVVAILVAVGGGPAAPAAVDWIPGEHGEASATITVENWGAPAYLAQPGLAVWANDVGLTHVTVTIDPGVRGLHGYYGRLRAPDAVGGERILYCGDEYRQIESPVVCGFDVPMSTGLNAIAFDLQSASFTGIRTTEGVVIGGSLEAVPVLEVRAADGQWQPIPRGGILGFRGSLVLPMRYRIMNTGDVPFRAPSSCQPTSTVWPYQQLLCVLRTPRPAYGTSGPVTVPIDVYDPVGGTHTLLLAGSVGLPPKNPERPLGWHA